MGKTFETLLAKYGGGAVDEEEVGDLTGLEGRY